MHIQFSKTLPVAFRLLSFQSLLRRIASLAALVDECAFWTTTYSVLSTTCVLLCTNLCALVAAWAGAACASKLASRRPSEETAAAVGRRFAASSSFCRNNRSNICDVCWLHTTALLVKKDSLWSGQIVGHVTRCSVSSCTLSPTRPGTPKNRLGADSSGGEHIACYLSRDCARVAHIYRFISMDGNSSEVPVPRCPPPGHASRTLDASRLAMTGRPAHSHVRLSHRGSCALR